MTPTSEKHSVEHALAHGFLPSEVRLGSVNMTSLKLRLTQELDLDKDFHVTGTAIIGTWRAECVFSISVNGTVPVHSATLRCRL
jgi:hypothetical protein